MPRAVTRPSNATTHHSNAPPPPPPELGLGDGLLGGGSVPVTVTVIDAGAGRLAPSSADTVTLTVPPGPAAGMTDSEHVIVVTPQSDGVMVTPGDPAATMAAGIEVVLVLVTEKCNGP